MPELAEAVPPLVHMTGAGEGPRILSPCTAVLLEPVVTHTLALVQGGLDGRSPSSAAEAGLVALLARLILEGGRAGLRAGAVPGLTMLDLAVATVQGGRTVLGALPPDKSQHVRALWDAVAAAEPELLGRVMREVSTRLQLTLDWAGEAVMRVAPVPIGAGLARALLADGLLLALPRGGDDTRYARVAVAATGQAVDPARAVQLIADPAGAADGGERAFAAALRRWDVGRALLERLTLVTPASGGGWLGPGGPLPETPRARLLVPRGGTAQRCFVVALRLDQLQAQVEAAAADGLPLAPVEAAWQQLIADEPDVLHSRHGSICLSVFTQGLAATTFAERATRTLSGPRILGAGELAPAVDIDASVRVSAGVATGRTWGGTDGLSMAIDGAVVGRAMALACSRPSGIGQLHGVGREPGGGVHCDAPTCAALLAEAAAQGRPVVDTAAPGGPSVGTLPIRGWWESRGRRMVLVGQDSAALVAMDRDQVEQLLSLARPAEPEPDAEPFVEDLFFSDAGERPQPPGWGTSDVDPLATERLINDPGLELLDEHTGDDGTALTDHVVGPFARRRGGADEITDRLAEPVAAHLSSDATPIVPAWDATGFSLPEFSQEMSADELLAQLDAAAQARSYSLEVDDDYGFEEDGPPSPRPAGGLDTESQVDPIAHAQPGFLLDESILDEDTPLGRELNLAGEAPDFDVFAWPDERAPAGAEPLLSGERSSNASSEEEEVFALPEPTEDDSSSAGPLVFDDGELDEGELGEVDLDAFDHDRAVPYEAPDFLAVAEAEVDIEDEAWDEEGGDDATASSGDHPLVVAAPAPPPPPPPVPPDEPITQPPPVKAPAMRTAGAVAARELANLFVGYVVVADGAGCFTFGLRDGYQLRDAHSYETAGDSDAAYRAFVQAKVAEGFVPRLDLWSPLPTEGRPEALDPTLLERAYMAMLTG